MAVRCRRPAARSLPARPLRWLLACLLVLAVAIGGSPASIAAEPAPTELGVTWPDQTAVRRGGAVAVSGAVSGGSRTVQLQHRSLERGWETLRRTTSDADGGWTVSVPTSWTTTHTLRVRAPATATDLEAVAAPTSRLRVDPGYRPLGLPTSFTLSGYRWNPCETIDYRVRARRLPAGVLPEVKQALRQVSRATGLRFRYRGTSLQVPWRGGEASAVRRADLLIGWATEREVPGLRGNVAGVGGPSRGVWSQVPGQTLIEDGMVALDVAAHAASGFGAGWTRGELLLHEIGHAVGLGHFFADADQIMAYATRDRDRFGAGDLAGLRLVGRSAGCLTAKEWGRTRPLILEPLA